MNILIKFLTIIFIIGCNDLSAKNYKTYEKCMMERGSPPDKYYCFVAMVGEESNECEVFWSFNYGKCQKFPKSKKPPLSSETKRWYENLLKNHYEKLKERSRIRQQWN